MPVYKQSPTNRPDLQEQIKKRWIQFFKAILVVLVLTIPVLIFKIAIDNRLRPEPDYVPLGEFRIPSDFTPLDLQNMIAQMRFNKEFQVYFYVAEREDIQAVTEQAYQILKRNQGQEALLKEIKDRQDNIEKVAHALNYLDLSEDFIKHPETNPKFQKMIQDYFHDAFVLTVLGLYYKVTHDFKFSFEWDVPTLQATETVKNILTRWKNLS